MKIKWLGHSCFKAEDNGISVVFDPFEPGHVPGYRDVSETADAVICSHGHGDHNYPDAVKLTGNKPEGLKITLLTIPHDDADGTKRGMNKIAVVEMNGFKVIHFGDIGCSIHDGSWLSGSDIELLKGADAALIPVGGFYTIDGRQAAEIIKEIKPAYAFPMHYRGEGFGYDVISGNGDFINEFPESAVDRFDSNETEIVRRASGSGETRIEVLSNRENLK
ncbi:MAG: MBL fold metallo-hydrolase [Lachnospiraceae bacterium]|nr:MBL fold metallo-hydrolase [Lachnospiraceae bacterium]